MNRPRLANEPPGCISTTNTDARNSSPDLGCETGRLGEIGSRSLAACRIGPYSFPIDVCEERFYTPGLLAKLLSGDTTYLEPDFEPAPLTCPPPSPAAPAAPWPRPHRSFAIATLTFFPSNTTPISRTTPAPAARSSAA